MAMLENKELQSQQPEGDYEPKKYTLRSSAITTLKITLLGGGALAAVWLLDLLVAS